MPLKSTQTPEYQGKVTSHIQGAFDLLVAQGAVSQDKSASDASVGAFDASSLQYRRSLTLVSFTRVCVGGGAFVRAAH